MKTVKLLPLAVKDLDSIWDYISINSEFYASKYIDRLEAACRRLGAMPGIGQCRSDTVFFGVRSVPEGSYVIFFEVGDDTVEILRIIHSARDMRRLKLR